MNRTKKEWQVRCADCLREATYTRKPKFGAFHWTVDGKCDGELWTYVREVTRWELCDVD